MPVLILVREMARRTLRVLTIFAAGGTSLALAAPVPCSLEAAAGSELLLTVPAGGAVELNLICTNVKAASLKLTLKLSQFSGDDGSVAAGLSLAGAKPEQPLPVTVPETLMAKLRLSATGLPSSGKYTGRLMIMATGWDPMVQKIVLTRGRGTLVVSPPSVPLTVTPSWWPWKRAGEPACSVTLRDKTGQASLEGITVRLEQVSKAPAGGFDLEKNVDFTFNCQKVSSFQSSPATGPDQSLRSIPAGRQATVGLKLKNLPSGEYNAVLRFQAANSSDDDAQRLTLAVQVRDSPWWAVLWLFVAIAVSFLGTKVLAAERQRASFLRRLRDARVAWLASEPQVLPVVRVRAAFRQAEELSRRFWLTSPDLVEARVTEVDGLLDLLDRIRRLRSDLAQGELLRPFVGVRAQARLGRILSQLGASSLDDATTTRTKAEITDLAQWLDPAKMEGCYWNDLRPAVASLHAEVKPATIKDATAKAAVEELADSLKKALEKTPETLDGKIGVEQRYAALKILWERRSDAGEFMALVTCWNQQPDIDALFELADGQAWGRLNRANGQNQLRIRGPQERGPTRSKLTLRSTSSSRPATRCSLRPISSSTSFSGDGPSTWRPGGD